MEELVNLLVAYGSSVSRLTATVERNQLENLEEIKQDLSARMKDVVMHVFNNYEPKKQ